MNRFRLKKKKDRLQDFFIHNLRMVKYKAEDGLTQTNFYTTCENYLKIFFTIFLDLSKFIIRFVKYFMIRCSIFVFLFLAGSVVRAQPGIKDNSFLLEEAYNQETGVIQHINAWQFDRHFNHATCSFTEEWPVCSELHQCSVTLPYYFNSPTGITLSDLLVNYRYQLTLNNNLFIAPRFSVILPTGKSTQFINGGMSGSQLNIPVSWEVNRKLAIHINVGNTLQWLTGKQNETSIEKSESLAYGISAIYFLTNNLNFLFETIHTSTFNETSAGNNEIEKLTILNPGMRFAINFSSGMQIVPGISMPYDVHSGSGTCFLYLSVEHPLKKIKS